MEKNTASNAKSPAVKSGAHHDSLVPARVLSRRHLVVSLVLVAIAFMLFPTIKLSFSKVSEIAVMEEAVAKQEEEHEYLSSQILRWKDENYVKQQARDRINMVMPGETAYWVTGKDLEEKANDSTKQKPESEKIWLDRLVESLDD